MPTYAFKCPVCKKMTEVIMTIGQFSNSNNTILGQCHNKKCKTALYRENQIINFEGAITGITPVTQVNRKYSNKAAGPKPIIDGKIRNDLKMPSKS